jgi:hypothetical protein
MQNDAVPVRIRFDDELMSHDGAYGGDAKKSRLTVPSTTAGRWGNQFRFGSRVPCDALLDVLWRFRTHARLSTLAAFRAASPKRTTFAMRPMGGHWQPVGLR